MTPVRGSTLEVLAALRSLERNNSDTSKCEGMFTFYLFSIPADINRLIVLKKKTVLVRVTQHPLLLLVTQTNPTMKVMGQMETSCFKPHLLLICVEPTEHLFFFFFLKAFLLFSPDSMLPLKAAPGQFGPEARTPGLQAWRVEKMKAVLLDPTEVGSFYNGDSYLVLDNRGEAGADIHMWIGEIAATAPF